MILVKNCQSNEPFYHFYLSKKIGRNWIGFITFDETFWIPISKLVAMYFEFPIIRPLISFILIFWISFCFSGDFYLVFTYLMEVVPEQFFHLPSTTNICHNFLDFLFWSNCLNHSLRYYIEHIFHSSDICCTYSVIIINKHFKNSLYSTNIDDYFHWFHTSRLCWSWLTTTYPHEAILDLTHI